MIKSLFVLTLIFSFFYTSPHTLVTSHYNSSLNYQHTAVQNILQKKVFLFKYTLDINCNYDFLENICRDN